MHLADSAGPLRLRKRRWSSRRQRRGHLDGQPLTDGVIHFMPVDGKSRTASTFVRDGHFQTRVPLGKQRVEISCVKAQPLRPGQAADSATGAEIVPAKYNTKSELHADVNNGANKLRFELSGK
ncbi:MAG: hypothetical protein JF612_00290 [Planctomycetia bacterium]|nr:hypothetical protein [Planctomycetia bacterium]